mgnify:CR=1 FL=1
MVNSVLLWVGLKIKTMNMKKVSNFRDFINEDNDLEIDEAKKVVDLDDAFTAFDDSEYEPSYKSHSDIANFIEFLRAEYPRGTIFD